MSNIFKVRLVIACYLVALAFISTVVMALIVEVTRSESLAIAAIPVVMYVGWKYMGTVIKFIVRLLKDKASDVRGSL